MSDRKRYKNQRQNAALQKRQGTLEYGQPAPPPRDREKNKAEFVQRKSDVQQKEASKSRWTKKPPSPQPLPQPRPAPRDDSQMHLKPLPDGKPVRAYRVEVQSFNQDYPHVNVRPDRRADLYTANKPTDVKSWYTETRDGRGIPSYASAVGKGKKTPRKNDPAFDDKFLGSRKGQPSGNRTFYNFGEPTRALHFHDQKSNNPTEIKRGNVFQIKSFEVPHDVFQRVVRDSVHENDSARFPDAPINVDRKAPNQFGLPQAYTSLLEARQIHGTARTENPEALRKKFPPVPQVRHKPPREKQPTAPNAHWASKGAQQHDLQHEVQQARHPGASPGVIDADGHRSVRSQFTLADFLTPRQKQRLNIR
jgi:hypothetical protein